MEISTENVNVATQDSEPSPDLGIKEKMEENGSNVCTVTDEQKFEIHKFIEECHARLHAEHVTMLETKMFENKSKIDSLLRECKAAKVERGLSGHEKELRRSYAAAFSEDAVCISAVSDSGGAGDSEDCDEKQLIRVSPDGIHVHALVDGTHTVPVKASLGGICNNISFNLARDSTGEIDFGCMRKDGSMGWFFEGKSGKIGKFEAPAKAYHWVKNEANFFGPFCSLQQGDRINLELEVNKGTNLALYRNGKYVCEINVDNEDVSQLEFAVILYNEGDGAEIRSFSSRCLPLKKPTPSQNKSSYIIHQGAIGTKHYAELAPQNVHAVEELPPHMSWTAIIKNTSVEDDPVLRVIPYFTDDDREGIDITLYEIDATREEDHHPVHDGLIFEATQKFEICPFLVTVLAEKLSRSTSYVRERHAKLLEDEGQSKEAAQQQEKKEKYLQDDKLQCRGLETYTAMFCRRCFKYDCDFHGIYHPQSSIQDCPAGVPSERREKSGIDTSRNISGLANLEFGHSVSPSPSVEGNTEGGNSGRKLSVDGNEITSENLQPTKMGDFTDQGFCSQPERSDVNGSISRTENKADLDEEKNAGSEVKAGDKHYRDGDNESNAMEGEFSEDEADMKGRDGSVAEELSPSVQHNKNGKTTTAVLPAQVLANAVKALSSETAAAVGERLGLTPSERQICDKANRIFQGNIDQISALLRERPREHIEEYVRELPRPSEIQTRKMAVLEPLREGFLNVSGAHSQSNYNRPFGARSRGTSKRKHVKENAEHTLAILRKQERLGVKHEYRPCTCALNGRPCVRPTCECIQANNFCEKFCSCAGPLGGCSNGFPGCSCRKTECRSVGCPCWDAFRECDPDVCSCGSSGMLQNFEVTFQDNVNFDSQNNGTEFEHNPKRAWQYRFDRHLPPRLFTKRVAERSPSPPRSAGTQEVNTPIIDSPGGQGNVANDKTGRVGPSSPSSWSKKHEDKLFCANMNLQLRRHQHLFMGRSNVAGWGVFVRDAVEKNEFIQEYTGEQMSQEEADRRGKIYDKRNSSYIFNLNNQTVLDAMRKGNKTRFANHSNSPNCFAKILLVRGDHRIGIFAKRRVEAGDELFYDYHHEQHDVVPEWHENLQRGAGRGVKRKMASS